ncbi:hypothetical protein PILCRDRAFT_816348 [Piloderma croceum F 1598]|uniref:Protein kinase domain-containing protein n=1 Tax=Piloderma croceum (strain F 1598) TaxID=765440 RepID=A0A0C3BJ88_PILCF|nr:hypothetical protein PILCRDRAFT_816348 [Piloderma croceum F 1598]
MATGAPVDYCAHSYKMSLDNLTGMVRKIQSDYFAYSLLTEIWMGEWSRGRSKLIVAVKVIRGGSSGMTNDFEGLDMKLLREARIWSQLDHPNIMRFYGVCYDLGRPSAPCLVCPYFKNGNVEQYLQINPAADRMKLVSQVADGVAYLHGRRIIHGDIKSRNILVSDDGEACIADFGLSRELEVSGFTAEFVRGTIRWMAHELLSYEYYGGSVPLITAASDTWAFGMTALEILTGQIPFYWLHGNSTVILFVIHGGRPSHRDYPWISQGVWQVLEGCWHEHPAQRPSMLSLSLCLFGATREIHRDVSL